jgi:hypothetical protein
MHKLEGNEALKAFADSITRYTVNAGDGGTAVIDLYGDNWKWYEDYPAVIAWNNLLQDAEECELDYEFARVGESSDDVVYDCSANSQYWLKTRAEILVNIPNVIEEEPNEQTAEGQG